MSDTEDRTESPSPRRREKAREEGQVPLSHEAVVLAGLATWTLLAMLAAPALARALTLKLAALLAGAHALGAAAGLHLAVVAAALAAAPFVFAALAGGVAASLLQTGFLVSFRRLQPDLARLSPRRGLARLCGREGLAEAGVSLLKLALATAVAWHALRPALPLMAAALSWTPAFLLDQTWRQLLRLLVAMLVGQTAIAGLDLLRVRLRLSRSLRMTREEVREEQKETEGDPLIRARIRRIRQQRARRRMLQAVRKAAVVVTNPTHYAVALAYDRSFGERAPRVVAKGVDEMAARIRTEAREHRVPLVANPPLARALYRVELDAEIPTELFQVVAEVIAYVWRLEAARRRAPAP